MLNTDGDGCPTSDQHHCGLLRGRAERLESTVCSTKGVNHTDICRASSVQRFVTYHLHVDQEVRLSKVKSAGSSLEEHRGHRGDTRRSNVVHRIQFE